MNIAVKIGLLIYIIIIIQISIISTVLFLKSKKNEKLISLLSVNLCALFWMFFATIEKFAAGSQYYLTIIRFPLTAIHLLSVSGLVFALFYLDILNKKTRKNVLFIIIPNLILLIPYFTNSLFDLVVKTCVNNSVVTEWGTLLWLNKILSYVYLFVAIILILIDTIRKKSNYVPNFLVVLSFVSPMLVHFLMEFKLFDPHGFDFTPVTFSIVFAIYSVLGFKYNAVDLTSKASMELFGISTSSVIVVDKDGKIEDFNKAFEINFNSIFSRPLMFIEGFFEEIEKYSLNSSEFNALKYELLKNTSNYKGEISLKINNFVRYYLIESIILKNKNDFFMGKMFVFYEVTDYKELVLLEERFKLSNNIHDSLGNSINVISSNLEYIINSLNEHKHDIHKKPAMKEIEECLEISYRKTIEAFIDLRRIVEGLSPIDIEKNGLIWALKSIINKLKFKGVNIEMNYSVEREEILNGEIGIELYHICEEALNNAIVHGKAKSIIINIIQRNNKISMYIIDDGIGCEEIVKNKGLSGMDGRVFRMGGNIKYGSPTEGGFNIKIEVPIGF